MLKRVRHDIRVYANRRLYDPVFTRYVTFDEVGALLRDGHHVTIADAYLGTDLAQKILTDIVVRRELEQKEPAKPLLTEEFLRELIRMQGTPGLSLVLAHCSNQLAELKSQTPPVTDQDAMMALTEQA